MPNTKIRCKKNLYNNGLCFSKGTVYECDFHIDNKTQLIDRIVWNDLKQPHMIGSWYKHFEIVE